MLSRITPLLSLSALFLLVACNPPAPSHSDPVVEKSNSFKADFGPHGKVELIGFVQAYPDGPRATDPSGKLLQGGGNREMIKALDAYRKLDSEVPLLAVFSHTKGDGEMEVEAEFGDQNTWRDGSLILHRIPESQLPKSGLRYTVACSWLEEGRPIARFSLKDGEVTALDEKSDCTLESNELKTDDPSFTVGCKVDDKQRDGLLKLAMKSPDGSAGIGTTVPFTEAESGIVRLKLSISPTAIGEADVWKGEAKRIEIKASGTNFGKPEKR